MAGFNGFSKTPIKEQMKNYSQELPENGAAASKFGTRLNHATGAIEPRSSKFNSLVSAHSGERKRMFDKGYDAIDWSVK